MHDPYAVIAAALARSGVRPPLTPESTMREVLDVSFELTEAGAFSGEVRAAWDVLRDPVRRLCVDLFHESVPRVPAPAAGLRLEIDLAEADASCEAPAELEPLPDFDWPAP